MRRLFVAVRPPAVVRDALLAAMGGIAAARWQTDDQLHLTMRFIGEVDRHAASDIVAALAEIRHPPIAARTGAIGSFAARGRPRAVWVGVEPATALTVLHHKIDQALVRAGVPPDARAFVPHITLARLGRNAGPLSGLIGRGVVAVPFMIDRFVLFESILTRAAAVYDLLAEFNMVNEIR